jgi:hypothetical protein
VFFDPSNEDPFSLAYVKHVAWTTINLKYGELTDGIYFIFIAT